MLRGYNNVRRGAPRKNRCDYDGASRLSNCTYNLPVDTVGANTTIPYCESHIVHISTRLLHPIGEMMSFTTSFCKGYISISISTVQYVRTV